MGYWEREGIKYHKKMTDIISKKKAASINDLIDNGENITDEEKSRMIEFMNEIVDFMETLDNDFWIDMVKHNYLPTNVMQKVGEKYKESIGDDCEWLRLILARNKQK